MGIHTVRCICRSKVLILEKSPELANFWTLRAKALSKNGKTEEAYEDICQAINLDPIHSANLLSYFFICVQNHRELEIAPIINKHFTKLTANVKVDILGYIEAALLCGQLTKHELSGEILAEVLRARNKKS